MATFVIDEELVLRLSLRLDRGSREAEAIGADLTRRADRIAALAPEVNAGPVVDAAGFAASVADVWRVAAGDLRDRVADIRAAALTPEALAEIDLIEELRTDALSSLQQLTGPSIRDIGGPGFADVANDPVLAEAVRRFDRDLLPKLLAGEAIDPTELTDSQREDLERIVAALGGDEITIHVHNPESDEDQFRMSTSKVAVTDAKASVQLDFVRHSLRSQAAQQLAAQLAPGSGGGPGLGEGQSAEGGAGGTGGTGTGDSVFSFDGTPAEPGESDSPFDTEYSHEVTTVPTGPGSYDFTATDHKSGGTVTGSVTEFDDGTTVATGTASVNGLDMEFSMIDTPSGMQQEVTDPATGATYGVTYDKVTDTWSYTEESFNVDIEDLEKDGPGGEGGDNGSKGHDSGWNGGYGTENDGDYNNNYTGI